MTAARSLSELVSSRICHDLISPIGAISNGVELIGDLGEASPEMTLIGDSVGTAMAKVGFFRLAFGAADATARVGLADAARTARAMFQGRHQVEWAVSGNDAPRRTVKAVFLGLLCLERTLPLGGVIVVNDVQAGVVLQATGRRVSPNMQHWNCATGEGDSSSIGPSEVQYLLLHELLVEMGAGAAATFGEGEARVTLPGLRLAAVAA